MLPVILNLRGKRAAVFGGGKVAERRAVKMLDAGARVTVVSKEFTHSLKKNKSSNLRLITKAIDSKNIKNFVRDCDFVIAATSDPKLNSAIESAARALGKLVNRADKPSDFIFPAVVKIDEVLVAVSTRGKSPAVAKLIKSRIRKAVSEEELTLVKLQDFARKELKRKIKDQKERKIILRELLRSPEIIAALKKDAGEAKKLVLTQLRYLDASHSKR